MRSGGKTKSAQPVAMVLAGMLDACAVVGSCASTRPPERLTARHPSAPSAKAPVKITAIVGVVRAELISSASPGSRFPLLSVNTQLPDSSMVAIVSAGTTVMPN
jgi:hypothetical protein